MNIINKLPPSSVHEDQDLAAKINEIIDVVNELIRLNNNVGIANDPYIKPGPSPYDLSAMGKILTKPNKA